MECGGELERQASILKYVRLSVAVLRSNLRIGESKSLVSVMREEVGKKRRKRKSRRNTSATDTFFQSRYASRCCTLSIICGP
jgi:hypothetical protein